MPDSITQKGNVHVLATDGKHYSEEFEIDAVKLAVYSNLSRI